MGNKVDLIEEIRDRLATAQSSGTLTEVKAVHVGSLREARKQQDMPFINIMLASGNEEAAYIKSGFTDNMSVEITLLHPRLASLSSNNQLYKTSDSSGALFVLEKTLDALDNNTSDVLDLSMNQKANDKPNYTYEIKDDADSYYEISIFLTIQSKQFQAGAR